MPQDQAPRGLIHALLLDRQGGCSEYPWHRVADWDSEEGTLWLHMDFEDDSVRQWLETQSGLSDIAYQSLLSPETRPRCLNRGDALLLTLRGINLNPNKNPDDMVSLRLWTDGRKIISTRRWPMEATEDVLADLAAGTGPRIAIELLVAWTGRIVARMNDTIEEFEDKVLDLEDRILDGQSEGIRLSLSELRRQTISIRRYLAPQREAMNRLASENLSWMDEMNRLRLREVNDRLIRHIEDIDEVRERAAVAQEELLSRISEQMNQRSYIFTVVATIFLPLGFFTGLMGINVGGMPGIDSEAGFWTVALMCLGIIASLIVVFRARHWL